MELFSRPQRAAIFDLVYTAATSARDAGGLGFVLPTSRATLDEPEENSGRRGEEGIFNPLGDDIKRETEETKQKDVGVSENEEAQEQNEEVEEQKEEIHQEEETEKKESNEEELEALEAEEKKRAEQAQVSFARITAAVQEVVEDLAIEDDDEKWCAGEDCIDILLPLRKAQTIHFKDGKPKLTRKQAKQLRKNAKKVAKAAREKRNGKPDQAGAVSEEDQSDEEKVELSKKEKKKVEKDQDKEFKARKKELKELKQQTLKPIARKVGTPVSNWYFELFSEERMAAPMSVGITRREQLKDEWADHGGFWAMKLGRLDPDEVSTDSEDEYDPLVVSSSTWAVDESDPMIKQKEEDEIMKSQRLAEQAQNDTVRSLYKKIFFRNRQMDMSLANFSEWSQPLFSHVGAAVNAVKDEEPKSDDDEEMDALAAQLGVKDFSSGGLRKKTWKLKRKDSRAGLPVMTEEDEDDDTPKSESDIYSANILSKKENQIELKPFPRRMSGAKHSLPAPPRRRSLPQPPSRDESASSLSDLNNSDIPEEADIALGKAIEVGAKAVRILESTEEVQEKLGLNITAESIGDSISGKAIDKVVSKAPLGGTRLGAKASSLTKGMASGMVTKGVDNILTANDNGSMCVLQAPRKLLKPPPGLPEAIKEQLRLFVTPEDRWMAMVEITRMLTVDFSTAYSEFEREKTDEEEAIAVKTTYDARTRALLEILASWLGIEWARVMHCENALATVAASTVVPEMEDTNKATKGRTWKISMRSTREKYNFEVLAAAVGGVSIGITGGIAAPIVVSTFGMITSSTAAAAAASTVSGTSAAVIGSVVGGVSGGTFAGVKRASALAGVKGFELVPIGGPGLAIHICIPGFFDEVVTNDEDEDDLGSESDTSSVGPTVPSTPPNSASPMKKQVRPRQLSANPDEIRTRKEKKEMEKLGPSPFTRWWSAKLESSTSARSVPELESSSLSSKPGTPGRSFFSRMLPPPPCEEMVIEWEDDRLSHIAKTVRKSLDGNKREVTAGHIAKQAGKVIGGAFLMSAGIIDPSAENADSPKTLAQVMRPMWSLGCDRADKAGLVLADLLIAARREGFSLGARVIFSCLQALSAAGRAGLGIVHEVILMGAPVPSDLKLWKQAREVVCGRLINAYSRQDWVLSVVHSAWAGDKGGMLEDNFDMVTGSIAGLVPVVDVDGNEIGVTNVDVTVDITNHIHYGTHVFELMQQLRVGRT